MVENNTTECRLIKDVQLLDRVDASTNNNQKNGEAQMIIKKDRGIEVNLLRQDFSLFMTNKEKKMNLLKVKVKRILKDENILFTNTPFGILIDMNFRKHIVFSEDPVGYKIYTDTWFELGSSTDRFMLKDDVFEALSWTILEINLDLHGNLPFNVYANNWEVA